MIRAVLPLLLSVACTGEEDNGKYSSTVDPTVNRPQDTAPVDDSATDDSATDDTAPPPTDWEQLGGDASVDALLDAFLANVAADSEINWMFANADLAALKTQLRDQISSATGGPYAYTGRDMVTVHAGMAITDAQWGALVGDLVAAMDSLGVDYTADFSGDYAADRLVVALAGMHDDIVTDPGATLVLFNQLGAHTGVSAVAHELVLEVAADARINGYFASTDLAVLEGLLIEQICAETGGYCVYTGRDMVTTHAGLGITDADFDALVEDLLAGLDDLNVDYTPVTFDGGLPADRLIQALAAMRADIVEN